MDNLADFTPERQYPPKIALFIAMHRRLEVLGAEAAELITEQFDEEQRQTFMDGVKETPLAPIFKERIKIPIKIGDADEAEFTVMGKFMDKNDAFTFLDAYLFSDGSPFMFEDDLKDYPYSGADIYQICVSPELEPFIASGGFRGLNVDSEGLVGSVLAHLEKLRKMGLEPRWLNDEECSSILEALPSLRLDIEQTARFNDCLDYFPATEDNGSYEF